MNNNFRLFSPMILANSYDSIKVAYVTNLIAGNPQLSEKSGLIQSVKNDKEKLTPKVAAKTPPQYPKYPTDKEALAVLREGERRKLSKAYKDDSNRVIMLRISQEENIKRGAERYDYSARMLYGVKGGKSNGYMRKGKREDPDKAAVKWGKYLSAYMRRKKK